MTMKVWMKWYGAEVQAHERAGAARGLYLWAEHVLEEATRIVPLEEGTLMRSGVASVSFGNAKVIVEGGEGSEGHVVREGMTVGTERGNSHFAAVSYDTPYAVRQHEEMDYAHQRGRRAKYLEDPLNASGEAGKLIIAREIRKSLG